MPQSVESFLICKFPTLPIRKEPSECSEMVSQILYGETAKLLEVLPNWYKIRMDYDGYEGWINCRGMHKYESTERSNVKIVSDFLYSTEISGQRLLIPSGSELETQLPQAVHTPNADAVLNTARSFLGVPYLWGGRSSFGFDCSGLVQIVFKIHGIKLPRDSKDQIKIGNDVNLLNEIKPADLAFFTTNGETISHVGILIDYQSIIHASGFVRIDYFDHLGIFNKELKEYTHKLIAIKRIL